MKTLYLDLVAGISGDMFLAALIDVGVDPDDLRSAIGGIAPGHWELRVQRIRHHGLAATHVDVIDPSVRDHSAKRQHSAEHHGHGPSRTYAQLREILQAADLADDIRAHAAEMLRSLAEAEAAVHGVAAEDVHFHEVGGLDTLVDLAGAAAGLKLLGVDRVVSSAVPWSHGVVDTAHGRLPVPAPATARLLQGLPVRPVDIEGETVTPTGAAIVRHFADAFGLMPPMTVQAIGIGAGTRDFGAIPNIVRIVLGEAADGLDGAEEIIAEDLLVLETNIDDMPPELFEPALEACFAAGALDAWMTPAQMKRNRPAVTLHALATPDRARAVAEAILTHTTTLGVRAIPARRYCLPREIVPVATRFGEIPVKVARLSGRVVTAQPEYRECVAAAQRAGVTAREVYLAALAAADKLLTDQPAGSDG